MKSVSKYVNNLDHDVEFILEPWAEEFQLAKGQELVVMGDYDIKGTFCQLDQDVDGVVFHAWEHSLVQVKIDGEDVTQTSNSIRF